MMIPPELRNNRIMLDEDLARQIGLRCRDCNSEKVVYAITYSYPPAFLPGAYCYKCLLERCRHSHMIPVPIEMGLLDKLEADLGINKVKKWYFFK